MKVTPVVAACIVSEDIVFLGVRDITNHPDRPDEKLFGYLELPGGKWEAEYEGPEEALVREVKEEYNLNIQPIKVIYLRVNNYSPGEDYLIIYYLCNLLDYCLEHSSTKVWYNLDSIEELDERKCLPGTKEALRIVKREVSQS